jgi:hypothetical protein
MASFHLAGNILCFCRDFFLQKFKWVTSNLLTTFQQPKEPPICNYYLRVTFLWLLRTHGSHATIGNKLLIADIQEGAEPN